jgi:hypothetical protein
MTGARQQEDTTLEDRVARLEALVARAIERGRKHPIGRQVIRLLGLDE